MSDNEHNKRRNGGDQRARGTRFTLQENGPPASRPQPIKNMRDPLEDLSLGPRTASRSNVAVKERAQPRRRPDIISKSLPPLEEEPEPPPLVRAADDVRRARQYAEQTVRRPVAPSYPPPSPLGGLADLIQSGPWLAVIVSAACLLVLYTLWVQPERTSFSNFPGSRSAPAAEVAPVAYPQLPAPAGENSVIGPPTISAEVVDAILAEYGSPATGTGAVWVELGRRYQIDPAFAVAFFIHESSAGTNPGWAGIKPDGTTTHNVGNIICAGYPTCFNRFRDYPNWETGIEDWYKLISVEYINGRGAHTVEQIIPIYAPSFENNVPAYVDAVNTLVRTWRAGGAGR